MIMFKLENNIFLDAQSDIIPCVHKASFRYEPYYQEDWLLQDFNDKFSFFKDKKALLFISVGQAYHEGSKFLAVIRLLNKYNFKICDIVMADTLQRHNFMRLPPEEAYEYTRKAGDYWLKRHDAALKEFQLPHSFIRWDDLLSHQQYSELREKIEREYSNNENYRQKVISNVQTYLERLETNNPGVSTKVLFDNGLKYLIEELPIVMPLWAKMGYDFIIYPKPITPAMKYTHELFVKDKLGDKCQWLYLRFKKIESMCEV